MFRKHNSFSFHLMFYAIYNISNNYFLQNIEKCPFTNFLTG